MKKIILTVALFTTLFSCNDSKPTYTNCIETSYNFNKEANNRVLSIDTLKGNFAVEIANDIKITGFSKELILNTENEYSLTNKKSGDTLIIQNLPTENTPSNVLKFGTEYKFYN